jgi:hypothetical protein
MNAELSALTPATTKVYLVLSLRDLRELTRAAERSLASTEANLGHPVKNRGNHCVVARTHIEPSVRGNCAGEFQLSSTAFRASIMDHPSARKLTKAERTARAAASAKLTAELGLI